MCSGNAITRGGERRDASDAPRRGYAPADDATDDSISDQPNGIHGCLRVSDGARGVPPTRSQQRTSAKPGRAANGIRTSSTGGQAGVFVRPTEVRPGCHLQSTFERTTWVDFVSRFLLRHLYSRSRDSLKSTSACISTYPALDVANLRGPDFCAHRVDFPVVLQSNNTLGLSTRLLRVPPHVASQLILLHRDEFLPNEARHRHVHRLESPELLPADRLRRRHQRAPLGR